MIKVISLIFMCLFLFGCDISPEITMPTPDFNSIYDEYNDKFNDIINENEDRLTIMEGDFLTIYLCGSLNKMYEIWNETYIYDERILRENSSTVLVSVNGKPSIYIHVKQFQGSLYFHELDLGYGLTLILEHMINSF